MQIAADLGRPDPLHAQRRRRKGDRQFRRRRAPRLHSGPWQSRAGLEPSKAERQHAVAVTLPPATVRGSQRRAPGARTEAIAAGLGRDSQGHAVSGADRRRSSACSPSPPSWVTWSPSTESPACRPRHFDVQIVASAQRRLRSSSMDMCTAQAPSSLLAIIARVRRLSNTVHQKSCTVVTARWPSAYCGEGLPDIDLPRQLITHAGRRGSRGRPSWRAFIASPPPFLPLLLPGMHRLALLRPAKCAVPSMPTDTSSIRITRTQNMPTSIVRLEHTATPPHVIHFCWTNCFTLELDGGTLPTVRTERRRPGPSIAWPARVSLASS